MANTERTKLQYYDATFGWTDASVYFSFSTQKTLTNENPFSASDTTLTVDDGSVFAVDDVIYIDSELMRISAISSNNLTVSRGYNSTFPAEHADNSPVYTATASNAVIACDIRQRINTAAVCIVTLINGSRDGFSLAPDTSHLSSSGSERHGPFHDVFDNFKVIRILDTKSKIILFYGVVYETDEKQDNQYGQTIKLTCYDYIAELRDGTLKSSFDYTIDTSENLHTSLQRADALSTGDDLVKTYSAAVSTRGGLVKSLIAHNSDHIAVPANTTGGNDKRFTESVVKFKENGVYTVGKRRRKSTLSHIEELAEEDPHSTATNSAISSSIHFGYDFYVDPNVTTTSATGANPASQKMYFNYFQRGSRPNPDERPGTYGLNIDFPHYYSNRTDQSDAATATNAFVETGNRIPMMSYSFKRPKLNVHTKADVDYVVTTLDSDGMRNTDTHTAAFECVEIKAGENVDDFKWNTYADGEDDIEYAIAEGFPGSKSAEYLEYNTASEGATPVWVTVGRIQWISDTNTANGGDFDTDDPVRKILISHIPQTSLVNANIWAEGAEWRGKTTNTAKVTVKRVPRRDFGIEKSIDIYGSSADTPGAVRQRVASVLARNTEEVVEGTIETYAAPFYYFDNSPSAINSTSSTTQTFTLASMNPQDYGITIGMCVAKLDSSGNPTSTYGYLSAVTSSTVTVTWATGTVATSDTIRYYIPLRAGDTIHVRNDQYKFNGNMLVTSFEYTEQFGLSRMSLTVSGVDNTSANIIARSGEKTKINMASNLNNSATSVVVDDGSVFSVNDVILVEDEMMNISSISSNTLTVERNYDDSKAASHNDNTSVYKVTSSTAQSGTRAPLASFVTATTNAINNNDPLPNLNPADIDPSAVSTTMTFSADGTDQVNWTTGTLTYKGYTITIDQGNTNSDMVSSGNGNTGQTGGALADGVKYLVYYDGNIDSSTSGDGKFKTIRTANYSALQRVKNGWAIIVAYVQYDSSEAVFYLLGRPSAVPTAPKENKHSTSVKVKDAIANADQASSIKPSYLFSNDDDTGMFRAGANIVAFAAGGGKKMQMSASNTTLFRNDGSTAALSLNQSDGAITVGGALSKGSGTFKIDHPLDKDNKYLYHGFIEGPNYDLLYRGKVTLVGGTATVNIDTVSNMTEGTFVALTQNPDHYLQNNTGWDAVKGIISGNTLTITCQNSSSTDTVSWMVVAERADDLIIETQLSDSDGHLIPEWNKSDID